MPEVIAVGGMELRFLQSREETGGALDLFEMTLPPSGRMPVPHYHESWEETVYGLSGTIAWRVDGKEVTLGPGESLFIPRGVVHGFRNESGTPARCLALLTPGVLGPTYFREIAPLVAAPEPDTQRIAAIMLRYGLVPAPQG